MEHERINIMAQTYNRLKAALHDIPDVLRTKPTTMSTLTPMVGNEQTFIVETYRQKESGDTIFLQCVSGDETIRIAVPAQIANAIARQREALSSRMRSKAAKSNAQARKDRGELPGFMKKGR